MKAKERMEICRRCDYKKKLGRSLTCGTPIIGEKINIVGVSYVLCGCLMRIKTKIKSAKCPIGKW